MSRPSIEIDEIFDDYYSSLWICACHTHLYLDDCRRQAGILQFLYKVGTENGHRTIIRAQNVQWTVLDRYR